MIEQGLGKHTDQSMQQLAPYMWLMFIQTRGTNGRGQSAMSHGYRTKTKTCATYPTVLLLPTQSRWWCHLLSSFSPCQLIILQFCLECLGRSAQAVYFVLICITNANNRWCPMECALEWYFSSSTCFSSISRCKTMARYHYVFTNVKLLS